MINWKIRFTKQNVTFLIRFLGALLIPVIAYMGLQFEDFTTWLIVWEAFLQFVSNPFLVILTIINAINIIPDPTTKGLADSERALYYNKPK
jgi:phi LC3 family holin